MKMKNTALFIALALILVPTLPRVASAQSDSAANPPAATAPATTSAAHDANTNTDANANTNTNANTDAASAANAANQASNANQSTTTTTSREEHTGISPIVWALLAIAVAGGIAYAINNARKTQSATVTTTHQTVTKRD